MNQLPELDERIEQLREIMTDEEHAEYRAWWAARPPVPECPAWCDEPGHDWNLLVGPSCYTRVHQKACGRPVETPRGELSVVLEQYEQVEGGVLEVEPLEVRLQYPGGVLDVTGAVGWQLAEALRVGYVTYTDLATA